MTVDYIEQTINKNAILGMSVSFVSGIFGTITDASHSPNETLLHLIASQAGDIGIIIGLLIGFITLLVKIKSFYKEFFLDTGSIRRRRKKTKEDDES